MIYNKVSKSHFNDKAIQGDLDLVISIPFMANNKCLIKFYGTLDRISKRMCFIQTLIVLLLCHVRVKVNCTRAQNNGNTDSYILQALIQRLDAKDDVIESLIQRVKMLETRDKQKDILIEQLTAKLETPINVVYRSDDTISKDADISVKLEPRDTGIVQKRIANNMVAFSTTLDKPIHHLAANEPYAFDRVLTNAGSCYNYSSGAFTAPVGGLYFFTTTIVSNHSNDLFDFIKNDIAVSLAVTGPTNGHYVTSGTQTVILFLNAGDRVAVANFRKNEDLVGNNFGSFTGFLMREIQPGEIIPEVVVG